MKNVFMLVIIFSVNIFSQEIEQLYDLMLKYYNEGNYGLAIQYGEKLLQTWERNYGKGDSEEYATIIINLAYLYQSVGFYEKAEPLYLEALEMYRRLFKGDHPDLARSINNMAMFYHDRGRYAEAEPLFNEALEMYRRLFKGDHPDLALSINNMAVFYKETGRYAEAEPLYLEALEMYRRLFKGDHPDLATSINNMAVFYNDRGRYAEAEPLYLEALEMSRRLFKGDHPDLAVTINNMAMFYNDRGRYAEAEPLYLEALEMYRRLFKGDHPDLASCISNMAIFYNDRGTYAEAEPLYLEALEMSRRLFKGDHPDLALSISNMALFYNDRGRYAEAEPLYLEALEMSRRLFKGDHPDLARSINNMAMFYHNRGRYTEAEPLFLEALKMYRRLFNGDHPDLATSINNLAGFYKDIGRYAEAEPLYLEALEMRRRLFKGDHPDLALSINNMAMFYKDRGRYAEAEALFIEALSVYKTMLHNYRASLSEKELQQFLNTFVYNFEFFNSFVYMHPTKTSVEHKVNNSLLTKGLMLNQSRNVLAAVQQSGNTALRKKYEEWKRERELLSRLFTKSLPELEQMGIDIDSLEKKVNAIEKELSKGSSLLGNIFSQEERTWQDIRNKLQEGEAVIDITRFRYFNKTWTDSVFYSFTIIRKDKAEPIVLYLKNGVGMENTFYLKYRYFIKNEPVGYSDLKTDTSYNIYWKPLNAMLKGIKKLFISLDGVYNKISLPSLKNSETGKYLFEEYDIVIVNNPGDILDQNIDKSKNTTAELFGYPNYDLRKEDQQVYASNYTGSQRDLRLDDFTRSGLERFNASYLPGTKEEIETIDSLLRKNTWNSKKHLWNDALEEAVKGMDESPGVLIIATHGFFLADPEREQEGNRILGMEANKVVENPLLRSGLLLTGATTYLNMKNPGGYDKLDNGILTAYEASQLNLLNTELVVLSACETGMGEVQNGEGVFGLQRAFIIAGADAVLMSLWKVDDRATKEFMIHFFNNWLKYRDKQTALRAAREAIRATYQYPYYWAAFVLIGE